MIWDAYEYQSPDFINEVRSNIAMDIYPNPALNSITIEISKNSEIEILNINGHIVKTIYNYEKNSTIDLRNLSGGVYLIKAKTDKGIAIKKFIKE